MRTGEVNRFARPITTTGESPVIPCSAVDTIAVQRAQLADMPSQVIFDYLRECGWVVRPLRSHGPMPDGVKAVITCTEGPMLSVRSLDRLPPGYPKMADDDLDTLPFNAEHDRCFGSPPLADEDEEAALPFDASVDMRP